MQRPDFVPTGKGPSTTQPIHSNVTCGGYMGAWYGGIWWPARCTCAGQPTLAILRLSPLGGGPNPWGNRAR